MKNISILLLLACTTVMAQTKLISHKSHSGSMATFSTALENNLFDIGASNFGEPPSELRYTIDSIILQPNNSAVIISSEKDVWITRNESPITLTGRDTVYNDPLLTKKHAKDSIIWQLQMQGNSHPVLINYDNDKTKKNSIPVVPNDNNSTPNMPLMVAVLALISILLGAAFYMLNKLKTVKLA